MKTILKSMRWINNRTYMINLISVLYLFVIVNCVCCIKIFDDVIANVIYPVKNIAQLVLKKSLF